MQLRSGMHEDHKPNELTHLRTYIHRERERESGELNELYETLKATGMQDAYILRGTQRSCMGGWEGDLG